MTSPPSHIRRYSGASAWTLALLFALTAGLLAGPSAGAQDNGSRVEDPPPQVDAPSVEAGSWVIIDPRTGDVLAGDNINKEAPMASTTKIMTALVTLQRADLDEDLTVSSKAAYFAQPIYSNAGLQEGDVLTVRETLDAALIVSGNDAATALAEHVGGGSVKRFVGYMNDEARRLGLDDTHFANPTGLDAKGHHTSARDLARLARVAFNYPQFRKVVSTEYTVVSTQDRQIPLTNINELLYSYPGATGVKTGTSPGAGACLVAAASRDGESYLAVLLDAPDRYGEADDILDYGFAAYDRRALIEKDRRYEGAQLPYRRDQSVPLVAREDVPGLVGAKTRVEREVSVPEDLPQSARKGQRIGEIVLKVDGERVGESALVAARGYEEAPVWQKVGYEISRLWN